MADVLFRAVTDTTAAPLNNTYFAIHNYLTGVRIAFGFTGDGENADGEILFPNIDEGEYDIRIRQNDPLSYVIPSQRQKITVDDDLDNTFVVRIHLSDLPVSTNANLCLCSGLVKTITGSYLSNAVFYFVNESIPNLEIASSGEGIGILPDRVSARSDANGNVSVSLYRGAKYSVIIPGCMNTPVEIEVPDRPSVNINDLLFPIISYITYTKDDNSQLPLDNPTELTIAIDETIELLTHAVYRSSCSELIQMTYFNAVNDYVQVESSTNGKLYLKGLQAGSVLLTHNIQNTIKSIPEVTIIGNLNVTVTP